MINSANRKRVEALVKRSTKHGQAGRSGKSRTYLIWQSMVGRCYRPSDGSYKWYGAKGVTVSERWRKFENFFEDMGTAPDGAHIHRVNGSTIYSSATCQWLNGKEHIGLHNKERGWGARMTKAQLLKELAAERETIEMLHRQRQAAERQRDSVIRQAGAERERRKSLVEALELARKWMPNSRCPTPNEERAYEIIDAALAQAKEQP